MRSVVDQNPETSEVIKMLVLARYKGKIFPVNQVHSAFVGFEEEGKAALGQLKMKDFYSMWAAHLKAPDTAYPELARIADDDRDGVVEVNRPDEIDTLLAATKKHLQKIGFPLAKRRLVWVSNDRVHRSGKAHRKITMAEWEASPFASTHKYSHDVAPARAALGVGGCTDCHSSKSDFFTRPVLLRPFGPDGRAQLVPAHQVMGIAGTWITLGNWREQALKPTAFGLLGLSVFLLLVLGAREATRRGLGLTERASTRAAWVAGGAGLLALALLATLSPELLAYMTAERFSLDAAHFGLAGAGLALPLGIVTLLAPASARLVRPYGALRWAVLGALALAALSGLWMLVAPAGQAGGPWGATRLAYFTFDLAFALACVLAATALALLLASPRVIPAQRPPRP